MNRNKPIVMRREGVPAAVKAPMERRLPVVPDFVHSRILAFTAENSHGVGVRKDRHGFTLFREDTGDPVARLRPQGEHQFAVLYWSRFGQRWRTIGDFGDMILRLDDALDFIAVDPMGCFWL
ncbi:hypothetical protein [Paludisphaera borealis]|uniref:Uncharacterized protein n=1 Tax=Paludisphaera borealis TaxID=1387353 RepID=A0A1U7CW98_9BACT|nr:hypothetical protein [Paludisphaera borealis]APW63168.1 hypothetical protein BSF38_04729 [Paludisphaera borealis]